MTAPEVTIGLPMFRQPPGMSDPPLPTVSVPSELPRDDETRPLATPTLTEDDQSELPPPIQDPAPSTRTSWVGRSHGAGDPVIAGRMIAGLLAIGFTIATGLLYQRGRMLRNPTKSEMDDFTKPLGRILVRYLPLDVVGPTLADATEAAAAGHAYVMDGPLTMRYSTAEPTDLEI